MKPFAPRMIVVVVSASCLLLASCGGGLEPNTGSGDVVRYTPDNLGEELLSRYKAAKALPERAVAAKAKGKSVDPTKDRAAQAKVGASKSGGAVTKGAAVDALVRDIASKAKLVNGFSIAQISGRITDLIAADPELPEDEKAMLTAKVKEAMGTP